MIFLFKIPRQFAGDCTCSAKPKFTFKNRPISSPNISIMVVPAVALKDSMRQFILSTRETKYGMLPD